MPVAVPLGCPRVRNAFPFCDPPLGHGEGDAGDVVAVSKVRRKLALRAVRVGSMLSIKVI
jgi:hypothetical protein